MDVQYLIKVDAAGAVTAIQKFNDEVDGLGKTSEDAGRKHGGFTKEIALGNLAADAAKKTYGFFLDQIRDSKQEFLDAEKANSVLNATLKNLGTYTDANEKVLGDFASQMAKVTTVDDDAVKSVISLGLRMGISKDQIQAATKSAIGLSKAFGVDLDSAMKMVANATEGEFAMMGRYIPQLKSTEDLSQKMAIATRAMADGFAIAEQEVYTTGGQLEQAQNKANNTKEAIGELAVRFETLAMRALTPVVAMLSDFCAWLDQTEQRAMKDTIARQWQESKAAFEAAATAAGVLKDAQQKLFEDYGNISKTNEGIGIYNDALSDLMEKYPKAAKGFNDYFNATHKASIGNAELTTTSSTVAKELERLKKLEDEARKKREEAARAAAAAAKQLVKYTDVLYDMPGAYRSTKLSIDQMIPSVNAAGQAVYKASIVIDGALGNSESSALNWSQSTIDIFNQVQQSAMDITGQVGNLFQALADRKMSILDKEYQAQRYAIEQSNKTEEEKYVALSKLEEEYNAKAETIRIEAAKKQKKIQYAMAIMDAAGAIVNALNTHPFIPAGLIAAATATIMGGIQVATIASTPLARGAIFDKPTILPALSGGTYQVAEAGEPEIVATPSNIRKALGMDRGGVGGRPMVIDNRITILLDGRPMKDFILRTVAEGSQLGKVKIKSKAVN